MSCFLRRARPVLLFTTMAAVTGCSIHTAAAPRSTVTGTQYAINGSNSSGTNTDGSITVAGTDGTASPGTTENTGTSSGATFAASRSYFDPAS